MNELSRYSSISKKFKLLFLIVIIMNVFSLLSKIPVIETLGTVCATFCSIFYALILMKLSSEHEYYKAAGISHIIVLIISLLPTESHFIGTTLFFSLLTSVIAIVSIYFEFTAHFELSCEVDYALASKWNTLKKWYLGLYILILASTLIVLILPILTIINVFVSLIGIIVVDIIKYVYLYKTSNVYKRKLEEENVSRETF